MNRVCDRCTSNSCIIYIYDNKKRLLIVAILWGLLCVLFTIGMTTEGFLSLPLVSKTIFIGIWILELFFVATCLFARRTEFHEAFVRTESKGRKMENMPYSELEFETLEPNSLIGIFRINNSGESGFRLVSNKSDWRRSFTNKKLQKFNHVSLKEWIEDKIHPPQKKGD